VLNESSTTIVTPAHEARTARQVEFLVLGRMRMKTCELGDLTIRIQDFAPPGGFSKR